MLRVTTAPGSASTVDAGPDARAATRTRAVIEELAHTSYAGRRVGTPGGRAAADWLAAHLSELGANARVDAFELPRSVREVYATPTLRWSDGDTTAALTFRREFCEHLASADQPSVHSGRIARPNAPAAGAWVVDGTFSAERVAASALAGAVGVLVPRGTDEQGWMPKMIAGPATAVLPVLAVRTDIHQRMTSAASASTAWVAASAPIRTSDVTAVNVYGRFRPVGPGGLAVLLAAHFDGVGDDPDGTRFPAAADNASGVAVVIEAARQLHRSLPPSIGLAVALLDAEEIGAHGSARHAPRVPPGTYVINVDGAAALHEAAAVEAGGPAHPLLAALDQAGRATAVRLIVATAENIARAANGN